MLARLKIIVRRIRRFGRYLFSIEPYYLLSFDSEAVDLSTVSVTADGFEMRIIPPEEFDELRRQLPENVRHGLAPVFRDKNNRCLTARVDGTLAYYIFVASGQADIEELRDVRRLEPGEVYAHTAYTIPEHRRKGIHTRAIFWLCDFLCRQEGASRILVTVRRDNPHSMNPMLRAGFKPVETFDSIRICGRYVHVIRRST